jgi:predicted transcriptional regulator
VNVLVILKEVRCDEHTAQGDLAAKSQVSRRTVKGLMHVQENIEMQLAEKKGARERWDTKLERYG